MSETFPSLFGKSQGGRHSRLASSSFSSLSSSSSSLLVALFFSFRAKGLSSSSSSSSPRRLRQKPWKKSLKAAWPCRHQISIFPLLFSPRPQSNKDWVPNQTVEKKKSRWWTPPQAVPVDAREGGGGWGLVIQVAGKNWVGKPCRILWLSAPSPFLFPLPLCIEEAELQTTLFPPPPFCLPLPPSLSLPSGFSARESLCAVQNETVG